METPENWSERIWSEHTTLVPLDGQSHTLLCPPGLQYLLQSTGGLLCLLLCVVWDAAYPAGPYSGSQEHEDVRTPSPPCNVPTSWLAAPTRSLHVAFSNPIAPTLQRPRDVKFTPQPTYVLFKPDFIASH